MKLQINIEYRTNWGEELVICIGSSRYPLTWNPCDIWKCEIPRFNISKNSEYSYEVVKNGVTIRKEWHGHTINIPEGSNPKVVKINDRWNDRPIDAPFYSTAFTKGIFARDLENCEKSLGEKSNYILQIALPTLRPNELLAIEGTGKQLENWSKIIPFCQKNFPIWTLGLEISEPIEYKLVIVDKETLKPISWEKGENRKITNIPYKEEIFVDNTILADFADRAWRGAGTAIPVFSLRSEDDFGVGEFYDLKKMVDWAASTGQSIVQLLPINDTTMTHSWEDSYPYNANSTFALHPQFVNLKAAGVRACPTYKRVQKELNSLEQIDYERVNAEKRKFLRRSFNKNFETLSATEEYKTFLKKNKEWLVPYATFCALRDEFKTPDFSKWGKYAKYDKRKVSQYYKENSSEVDFNCFIQYHLDKQLSEVCKYAHSKGVVLKGDLPIGISRTSVDAWIYPELFHMDSQAGAPPDAFSEDGQNWGFPTYNWEKMAEDDFAWWKARLAKMSEYFDAFRIDHILGFFRIWQIPLSQTSGLEGYFNPALPYEASELSARGLDCNDKGLFIEDPHKSGYYHPKIGAHKSLSYSHLDDYRRNEFNKLYNDFFYYRHNEFWKESAMKKLPALLDSTGMLACGEDLGMIPATVPDVMNDLKILSLEIQRMPKSITEEFAKPANYPYLSVCTTSTHDMNPIRAWWEEDREVTARFYYNELRGEGDVPYFCEPWVCRTILEQHLASGAMLTILPLQDWLSISPELRFEDPNKERINVPANSRHYWRYRMHLTIEQLISEESFNEDITNLIKNSGRVK